VARVAGGLAPTAAEATRRDQTARRQQRLLLSSYEYPATGSSEQQGTHITVTDIQLTTPVRQSGIEIAHTPPIEPHAAQQS
jgi:hypothetical protein